MLETHDHGSIRELRLARPPANALAPSLIAALREALETLPPSVRGVLLSGREGMFSAGLDVPAFLELDRSGVQQAWTDFFRVMRLLAESPRPVACALTGHAPAGGCVLALFCDWRVMAEGKYKIGLNEVQVGLRMPPAIHRAAVHVVGTRQAERMSTTAELFPVDEAYRIGLVDEIVPVADVVPRTLTWLEARLKLPSEALRVSRALARQDLIEPFDALDADALDHFIDEWFGEETQGAMKALVESLAQKSR